MAEKRWMDSLKKGSLVILEDRGGDTVKKVERTTKTMIILEGGSRFNRKSGRESGGNEWYPAWVSEATPEIVAKTFKAMKHREALSRLMKTNWERVEGAVRLQIVALLEKQK